MQTTTILVLGLAIFAYAYTQSPDRFTPSWARQLKGWQKVFGLVAVVLALLVILNPEFLALGLLGDTAFFDFLVLALSLQFQATLARAWRWVQSAFSTTMRILFPRPRLGWALILLFFAPVGDCFSAIQKAVHRISS
jgi:uncharacterized membrane protein YkgB